MTQRQQDAILVLLRDDPGITFRTLAAKVDMSLSGVFDQVQVMRSQGLLDYGKCPTCGRGIIEVKGDDDGRKRIC